MTSTSGDHGSEYPDRVFLYAAQALPASERLAVEAHIAACADCRQEFETLRPVIDSFAAWPSDELSPSASLWERLAQRVAAETGRQPALPSSPSRWAEAEWKEAAPGVSCKVIATDTEKSRVTVLVRFAPGTEYPGHRHAGIEEIYMLEGALTIDAETLHAGDYRRRDSGSVDRQVSTETGCTCLLITSLGDVIF